MQTFKKWIAVAIMIVLPLAMVGCGGCKSNDAGRAAYVTSGVTHVGVTAGLRGWNDYLGREYGEINALAVTDPEKAEKRKKELVDKERQVKDAYVKYQAAQTALLTAAQEFSKIPPNDPNAPGATDRLNAAIAASTATLAQVVTLLETFGVKVK